MVWHHHVGVVNLLEGAQCLEHIYIALVWKNLDKIEEAALDVTEVDIKQFLPFTKIADDIVDILTRIL